MKIKLSELRQLIKSVIKEQVLNEMNQYPPMGGATDLLLKNGFTVVNAPSNTKFGTVELKRDDVSIILKSTPNINTIQIQPQGEVVKFNTINDSIFRSAVMMLYLDFTVTPRN